MRDQYYEQMDAIVDDLVSLTGSVRNAVAKSTRALLGADGNVAEAVIAGDKDIDEAVKKGKGAQIMKVYAKEHPDKSVKIVRGWSKGDTAVLL